MPTIVRFGVLGPFEVVCDGAPVRRLGGVRQRAVLALLLLRANEVVSSERLIDDLWPEGPPDDAKHVLATFVYRLRNALGPARDRLVSRDPGYVLEVAEDELDSARCERLYSHARAALARGEPEPAAEHLREARGLWRGEPLDDFTYEPFAQAAIARLEELRVACREELVEAELALGHHAELVSDLEELVRRHPFRQRLHGQLMLCLYRCGREAEALEAYMHARTLLVQERGMEPAEQLRELQRKILSQDPSLRAAPVAPPVVTVPEPAAPARKTATVLVAELAPQPGVDVERAEALLRRARARAREIVERHDGQLITAAAGPLLVVFGVPAAHEDDALRALRVADELRGAADGLELRIGVDTGIVLADPEQLTGAPLRGGAALAAAAADGEILLSEATRRLTPFAIAVEAVKTGTWRLQHIVPGAPPVRRALDTPMVDRVSELTLARDTFERAAGGEPRMLTVLGDAGLGKSRLAYELASEVEPQATVLKGRCLSYGDGIAFWPLREAIAQAAGAPTREAIRRLLGTAEDADPVADVAAAALGLGGEEAAAEQVPWAFRRVLEELAGGRPLLLVIDDIHWAEPPLLDLIDYLVDWLAGTPVMLLCLARLDLLETRPRWGDDHVRAASMVLGPLDDVDTLRLIDTHAGSLGPAERRRILESAEGNPLFLEQLAAMRGEDPFWDGERALPGSVEALLSARLDRLGPAQRACVECAAIVGREFSAEVVVELLPEPARPSARSHLAALADRGLIRPVRARDALCFHHILIRDVAYRSIPKARRGELHERFAALLGDDDEFAGYHLDQAFGYRHELQGLEPEVVELGRRAGQQLATTARHVLMRGEARAAARLLDRAAELLKLAGVAHPDVLLDLGFALSESGDFENAERRFREAFEQAGDELLATRALLELSYCRVVVDPSTRVAEMHAVADQAVATAERLGDDAGRSRALLHRARAYWTQSRCAEMEEALQEARATAEPRERSQILGDLARATLIGPTPVQDGIARCELILLEAGDDASLRAVTEAILAVLEALRGQFEVARARWTMSRSRLELVGLDVTRARLGMYGALVELAAGTPGRAREEMLGAYDLLARIGERHRLPTTAAVLARVLFAEDRLDEAERYCELAASSMPEDDVVSQVMWHGTYANVLARAGERGRALELVERGVWLAETTDFILLHADALRERALVTGSAEDLAKARQLYEAKGATAWAARLSSLEPKLQR